MASDELQRDLDALAKQVAALKFQINPASGVRDNAVGIERDGSSNLVLFDSVTGSKTLAQLAAGGASYPLRVLTGATSVPSNSVLVNHDVLVSDGASLTVGDGGALVLV